MIGATGHTSGHQINTRNLGLFTDTDAAIFNLVTRSTAASLAIQGGNVASDGGQINVYGSTHATLASKIEFYNAGVLSGAFASTGAFSAKGTNTNDSAAAGFIGQYLSSYVSAQAVGTSATWTNLTTISCTAGDWDVSANWVMDGNGGTSTLQEMAVSLFSGGTTTDHQIGDNYVMPTGSNTAGVYRPGVIPAWRVSVSGTTTVYLKNKITYSVAGQLLYGRLSARRVR